MRLRRAIRLPSVERNWRGLRCHAAAVVVVVAALGMTRHDAFAGRGSSYALEPKARDPILAALRRMQPALVLGEGAIDRDHVVVRLCPRSDATDGCFRLRLEHPDSECGAARWGRFCAQFPDGEPPPPVVAVIADALRSTENEAVWTDLARVEVPSGASRGRTLAIALALVLGPLAAAYGLGAVWRRRAGEREGTEFTLGAIVVPVVLAVGLDAYLFLIGIWDAAFVGLLAGLGLLLAAHRRRPDWKTLTACVVSAVVSLVVAEAACRALLRPPAAFPMDREPTLSIASAVRQASWFSMACASIYGNEPPPAAFAPVYPGSWTPRADVDRRILHLGDSMVQGSPTDGRFTDDLGRLEPAVEHVNAAIGGVGPDVHLAILRRFMTRSRFDAVVMHLTPNDYDDVDRPSYPCSEWKPLLVYDASGTRLRFAEARADGRESRRVVWQQSPPPYVLRAATRFSSLATHLAGAMLDLQRRMAAVSAGRSAAEQHAHFTAIMRDVVDETRDHDVPLVVNLFHDRLAIERARRPSNGPERTMHQIAEALGVVVLDTWEPLVAAAARDVALFTNQAGPTDSHFGADGHALVAHWLHRELQGAIARASATPP